MHARNFLIFVAYPIIPTPANLDFMLLKGNSLQTAGGFWEGLTPSVGVLMRIDQLLIQKHVSIVKYWAYPIDKNALIREGKV